MEVNNKINKFLADMADDMIDTAECLFFWGETEVPNCLKQKYEEAVIEEE